MTNLSTKVKRPIINAHAGGTLYGVPYSNCREAYENAYAKGARSFEIDISVTKDGRFVASHVFSRVAGITEREFLKEKVKLGWHWRRGTSLNLDSIARLADVYPDVTFMFDLHFSSRTYQRRAFEPDYSYDFLATFDRFFRQITALGLVERSVIECYSAQHILEAESVGGRRLQLWIDVRDRMYPALGNVNEYIRFCANHPIVAVSLPGDWLRENSYVVGMFHKENLMVYSSSWERLEDRHLAAKMGVDYITVDHCRPIGKLEQHLHVGLDFVRHQLFDVGSGFRVFIRQHVPLAKQIRMCICQSGEKRTKIASPPWALNYGKTL